MIICTRYPLARQNTSCHVKRFTSVDEITRNRPSRAVALNYYYARVHTRLYRRDDRRGRHPLPGASHHDNGKSSLSPSDSSCWQLCNVWRLESGSARIIVSSFPLRRYLLYETKWWLMWISIDLRNVCVYLNFCENNESLFFLRIKESIK